MGYEFWISRAEVPVDDGLNLDDLLALLRGQPGWAGAPIKRVSPQCAVLIAPVLGEIECTTERLLTGLGNKCMREFLLALRPLLLALAPLGFQGFDPQLGRRPVEAGSDPAEFLRQYRRLIPGRKVEFDYWCTTGIPPEWIAREQARQAFEDACRDAFKPVPGFPDFMQKMVMDPADLEALLDALITTNQKRIASSGLGGAIASLTSGARHHLVRANGERLPILESWYYGSSLQQEMMVLDVLHRRGLRELR